MIFVLKKYEKNQVHQNTKILFLKLSYLYALLTKSYRCGIILSLKNVVKGICFVLYYIHTFIQVNSHLHATRRKSE